ncbi:hypothetical protein AVL61_07765 [Kocuria rosea subsp. polaris]|uniref:Uncharacterized protein n=1 Tax=Kocuria rosea subsp. polaris TaxID=136273 RepID=A0A0W8ILR5_KOCRO|nr:hypothetical protein AVL61_07765 [Kocuria polaris]
MVDGIDLVLVRPHQSKGGFPSLVENIHGGSHECLRSLPCRHASKKEDFANLIRRRVGRPRRHVYAIRKHRQIVEPVVHFAQLGLLERGEAEDALGATQSRSGQERVEYHGDRVGLAHDHAVRLHDVRDTEYFGQQDRWQGHKISRQVNVQPIDAVTLCVDRPEVAQCHSRGESQRGNSDARGKEAHASSIQ